MCTFAFEYSPFVPINNLRAVEEDSRTGKRTLAVRFGTNWAKREVLDLVKALRNEGVSIILISTEPETVLAESDRILVMSKGQITKEFVGERVSKDLLMSYA